MQRKIVIIGAGAIGRGFLPWVIPLADHELIYVDIDQSIISKMKEARKFDTYRVVDNHLEKCTVGVKDAYLPEAFNVEEHQDTELIFINVGPRNCLTAARLVQGINARVIVCENDRTCVDIVQRNTKIKRCYFAVPDVITSNSAPEHLTSKDPLSVITEDGQLFIDNRVGQIDIDCRLCTPVELDQEWTAKLYLHNTPHCIAAYLGALSSLTYVHEVMEKPHLDEVVRGCMQEMLKSLKLKWEIPHSFLNWYAEKELKRFACNLLCDPIKRVAREPIRKLELNGRLVGAAQICLSLGFIPENILIGIGCALLFNNSSDPDQHLSFIRRNLSNQNFSTYILGLRKGEALEMILNSRLDSIFEKVNSMARE